jgi:hypothetical protein
MTKRIFSVLALSLILMLLFPAGANASELFAGENGVLPPPEGLSVVRRAEDTGKRIALTWKGVEGAFGYRVYRSESADGPLEQVGGKGADSMADFPVFLDDTVEPGKGYFYAVAAVDAALNESPLSGRVYAELEGIAKTAAGPKSMTCSLSDQRIYFFEGNQLVNIMRCSSGRNNATPTGRFSILGHARINVGLGGAVCDYWMSFTSSHGIHAWPRGLKGYETGLGAPASHGCIRLHPLEAYWPYNWAPNGTPLLVTYSSYSRRVISGCHDAVGAPELSTQWYFAEGYTGEAYDTYLLFSNPGEQAANAQVRFLKDGGGVVEGYYGIAPHSRFTLKVDDVPLMDACAFATQIFSDAPIMAERAMYFAAGEPRPPAPMISAWESTKACWPSMPISGSRMWRL